MKIKEGYLLRKVADSYVALSVGAENEGRVVRMNSTGAFIWEIISKGAELEDAVSALKEKYGIDDQTATKAATDFIEMLRKEDLLA